MRTIKWGGGGGINFSFEIHTLRDLQVDGLPGRQYGRWFPYAFHKVADNVIPRARSSYPISAYLNVVRLKPHSGIRHYLRNVGLGPFRNVATTRFLGETHGKWNIEHMLQ